MPPRRRPAPTAHAPAVSALPEPPTRPSAPAAPPAPVAAQRRVRIRPWTRTAPAPHALDVLAFEEPLELRVQGRAIAVMMRTPGHDDELAAGFLLSEGVIHRPGEIAAIRHNPRNRQGNVIDVILEPRVRIDLSRLTRHVFGASSCGLCGKASIAAVRASFPPRDLPRVRFAITAETLLALPDRMRTAQAIFGRTGGLHAAALFASSGEMLAVREDIGRHNAVDKLLGRALLEDALPLNRQLLLVSGRASFEILQKALAGSIPFVAAVGAPSSLAVEFARENGQTLVGFLRDERFNVYSGQHRVQAGGIP